MNSQLYLIEKEIKDGNINNAEKLCWQLLDTSPNDFHVNKALGLCLLLQRKNNGAIEIYEKTLAIKDDDFDVNNNIAQLYLEIEELEKTKKHLKKATEVNPQSHLPYITYAELSIKLRNFEEGKNLIEKSISILGDKEKYAQIHQLVFSYGDILIALDKKAKAIEFVKECFEISKDTTIFYYLMNLKNNIYSRKEIDKFVDDSLQQKYQSEAQAHLNLAPLYFGLGRYSASSDTKLSEHCYLKANEHSSLVQRFNPLQHQKHIKNIKKIYEKNLDVLAEQNPLGEGLIFIVGMPRSGTTLVESILGSNNNVASGGEMISMTELLKKHYEDEIEDPDFSEIASKYLGRIKPIKGEKKYFIDKLPGNYYHVGLILLALPNAKIIHILRDPWDIAVSLFKQLYISNIPFSSKFFSIACTIGNYQHITAFWKKYINNGSMLEINYEDIVADSEKSTNLLYDFVGVEKDLKLEKREKFFSRTASKTQVQGKIHSKSVKKNEFIEFKEQFLEDLKNQQNYWK